MICKSCCWGWHAKCQYPVNCTCQHGGEAPKKSKRK